MINAQIGPREDYANAQLTITALPGSRSRQGVRSYQVVFDIAHWRYFEPRSVRLDTKQLLALAPDPCGYGLALGKALFSAQALGPDYAESLAAVQGRGDGLRVRLVVEPAELQEILWERLYHPVEDDWLPIGSTATTPFSRFVRPQQWNRPAPVTERPLRMLLVIASPADLQSGFGLDPIDPQERQWIRQALGQLPDLSVTCLESGTASPPTLNAIRSKLADGYHLVHFLCHGARTKAGTGLFLEDEAGQVDPVDQARLLDAFRVLKTPPVACFLAACESALHDRHDALLPLGPALVAEGGVQAAVAMTGKVGLKIAQVFAAQFYARLLKHGVVDLAVNEARALVQDDWDWGVPVLFTRIEDNQLIDFPVGGLVSSYLVHTDQAYQAVDEALSAARMEEHGQKLLDDLQALVDELSKSHGVLVEVTSQFRRTGRDPQTFAQNFEKFYYDFKEYYDGQTWVHENTSCQKISELSARILPKLSPLLKPDSFDQLRQELAVLGSADADLLHNFSAYLDAMNAATETIWDQVEAGKIEEAIQAKRDFEDQISPSMQRSKAAFERMSHGIRGVSAA